MIPCFSTKSNLFTQLFRTHAIYYILFKSPHKLSTAKGVFPNRIVGLIATTKYRKH